MRLRIRRFIIKLEKFSVEIDVKAIGVAWAV